jgi:CHASE2 domain-containing sensor protein
MSVLRRWANALLSVISRYMPFLVPVEKKTWHGFGDRLWHAKWAIALLVCMMGFAQYKGWFVGFEMAVLDSYLSWHSRDMSHDIVLVEITENDYRDIFNATSPLDKFKLLKLIGAVKKYNPSVIGVDIVTDDWQLDCQKAVDVASAKRCEDELVNQLFALRQQGSPPQGSSKQVPTIVWAATPKTLDAPMILAPPVGGLPLCADQDGVPRFPMDREGSVRHFESRVQVPCLQGDSGDRDGKCWKLTLARTILAAYPVQAGKAADEQVIFNFYGDRYRFPTIAASEFISSSGDATKQNQEIEQRRAELLEGKIVLIGGAFQEARDSYFTPLGAMQGVELNALAIQTDLSGGGITHLNELLALLADVVISIFVIGMFYLYEERPKTAVWLSVLALPTSAAFSVLLFHTFSYWFNFIPAAGGMVIHQLYELAVGAAEAHEKIREMNAERAGKSQTIVTRVEEQIVTTEHVEVLRLQQAPSLGDRKTKGAAGGGS